MLRKLLKAICTSDRVLMRASATFFIRSLGVFSAFILNIIIARYLGLNEAGIYFLSMTIIMSLAMFVRMGVDNTLIKVIGIASEENDYEKIINYMLSALLIIIITGLPISFSMYVFSGFLDTYVFKSSEILGQLKFVSFSLIPVAVIWLLSGCIKGVRRPASAGFVESVGVPLFTLIILLFTVLLYDLNALFALQVYLVAVFITIFVGVYVCVRVIPVGKYRIKLKIRELLSMSLPIMVITVSSFLIMWLPSLLLGVFSEPSSVALYNVSFRVAALLSFVLVVMNSVLSPRFAVLYKEDNIKSIEILAVKSTLLMGVMISPLVIMVFFYSDFVLMLFGNDFIQASTMLKIISIGQVFNVLTGSVGFILMMTGHEKIMRNIVLFTLFVSIILNIFMINTYGSLGAAITICVCMFIQNGLMSWAVYKSLGIRIFPAPSNIRSLFPRELLNKS